VEHFTSTLNAAEAYRKASGRDAESGPDASRQLGHKIRVRPRVQLAIESALKDRNSDARCDRQWLLAKLLAIIDKCDESNQPGALNTLIEAITLIAKIKGELRNRSPKVTAANPNFRHNVKLQMARIIAEAKEGLKTQCQVSGREVEPVSRPAADPDMHSKAALFYLEPDSGHRLEPAPWPDHAATGANLQLQEAGPSRLIGPFSHRSDTFMGVEFV
jgi:hypothetical protein